MWWSCKSFIICFLGEDYKWHVPQICLQFPPSMPRNLYGSSIRIPEVGRKEILRIRLDTGILQALQPWQLWSHKIENHGHTQFTCFFFFFSDTVVCHHASPNRSCNMFLFCLYRYDSTCSALHSHNNFWVPCHPSLLSSKPNNSAI